MVNPSDPMHIDALGRWEPENLIAQLQESLVAGDDDARTQIQPLLLSPLRGFMADWLNRHTGERGGLTPGQVVLLSAGDVARDLAYFYASDALYAGHPTLMVTPRINPSRVIRGIAAQHLPMEQPSNWGGMWPLASEEFAEHNLKEWLMTSSANTRLTLNLPHLMAVLNSRLLQVAPIAGTAMVTPIGLARLAQEFAEEVSGSEAVRDRVSLLVLNQLEAVARAGHLSGTEARLEAVELLARHAYNSNMALIIVVDEIDAELHALADFSLSAQKMRKVGGDMHGEARYDVADKQGAGGGMSTSDLANLMGNNTNSMASSTMAPSSGGQATEDDAFRIGYRERSNDRPEQILVWSHHDGFCMPVQETVKWQDGGAAL